MVPMTNDDERRKLPGSLRFRTLEDGWSRWIRWIERRIPLLSASLSVFLPCAKAVISRGSIPVAFMIYRCAAGFLSPFLTRAWRGCISCGAAAFIGSRRDARAAGCLRDDRDRAASW